MPRIAKPLVRGPHGKKSPPDWAPKFAAAKVAGLTNKEAAIEAGYSPSYANAKGAELARRQEVIDELIRCGEIHPNEAVGKMSVGVLVEKLADYKNISNREIAPFIQMGLQTGKKIGAGSVQQAPINQTNIQVNISPLEQELMKRVMLQIQAENPGKTILIEGVTHEGEQGQLQNPEGNEGIQAGDTEKWQQAGSESD